MKKLLNALPRLWGQWTILVFRLIFVFNCITSKAAAWPPLFGGLDYRTRTNCLNVKNEQNSSTKTLQPCKLHNACKVRQAEVCSQVMQVSKCDHVSLSAMQSQSSASTHMRDYRNNDWACKRSLSTQGQCSDGRVCPFAAEESGKSARVWDFRTTHDGYNLTQWLHHLQLYIHRSPRQTDFF